mgnify:CR=1 FL=1
MNSEHLQFLDEIYGDCGIKYITKEDQDFLNQMGIFNYFNNGRICFETLSSIQKSKPLCVFDTLPYTGLRRNNLEYFNNDWLQCIVAACIHESEYIDGNAVLFLKLVNPGDVSDYRKDTLTFPQGHVQYIADENYTFREILDYSMRREIQEELGNNWTNNSIDDGIKIEEIISIIDQCDIYPIYINKPGSSRKHLCFLYDIDISKANIQNLLSDCIISNERSKHTVVYLRKEDFISGHYIKNICPWVMAGFHEIPFFQYW